MTTAQNQCAGLPTLEETVSILANNNWRYPGSCLFLTQFSSPQKQLNIHTTSKLLFKM